MTFGYAGQILRVDLSSGEIKKDKTPMNLAKMYLGSRGFASRLLYDMVRPGTDPFGPKNVLIFSAGPLTGLLWPTTSRYTVTAKSPATNALGYANSAGHWGPELKFAGYDAIIFEGKAEKPKYLLIQDEDVQLKDAQHLWGKNVFETEEIIKKDVGDSRVKVAAIGQAGEKLVKFAAIINDLYRAAGRTGMGAVMGSKKLKAIAVRGTGKINIAKPKEFLDYGAQMIKECTDGKKTAWYGTLGTAALISSKQRIGDLPTKNHQSGQFPWADEISGETIKEKYFVRYRACFSCPIHCSRITQAKSGPYAGLRTEGPEYETIDALGPMCWNRDFGAIVKGNILCDQLGLDTISTGVAIAFAMELWEKGIITPDDTGGLDLSWGDAEAEIRLIEMIANREGIGDILAEGVRVAAERIGKGAERYALHVKGVELPRQEPRAIKAFGLAHATANRGADHLYHLPTMEYGMKEEAVKYLGLSDEQLSELFDLRSPAYKALECVFEEKYAAVADSLGVCKFSTKENFAVEPNQLARAMTLVTGEEWTEEQLLLAGQRIVNLERSFNAREGLSRKDDTLPRRFLEEPYAVPGLTPTVTELERMLDEYYELEGWDKRSGLPTVEKLKELGLEDVAEELRSMKII
jgi:aldehyde:ferredoxin oxidoreductase